MPRKRRWRATLQQSVVPTPQTGLTRTVAEGHMAPTPIPLTEIRHVGFIVAFLFTLLLGTAITLQTGSNQARLDSYLATLLN